MDAFVNECGIFMKVKGGATLSPKKSPALKMAMIKGQWEEALRTAEVFPLKRPLPADSGDFTRIFLQGGVSLIVLKKFHQLDHHPLKGGEGKNVTVHFNVCKTSLLEN